MDLVERAGGLPEYICKVAKALIRSGMTTSRAIATSVSRIKRWAAGLDGVTKKTQAKAAAAVAEWEKKKASTHAKDLVKASAGDFFELTYNDLSVLVNKGPSDAELVLAAQFENCSESNLDKVLRRDQKEFISLSQLTAKKRDKLSDDDFALPGRRYPIHDLNHAKAALSRVAQFGTPEEKKKVRAATCKRWKIGCDK